MNRRDFCKTVLSTTGLILLPSFSLSFPALEKNSDFSTFWTRDRTLEIQRQDNKEKISAKYFVNGQYDQKAYQALCWIFRDAKDQNKTAKMSRKLIDLFYAQQEWLRMKNESNPLITLNSGYRKGQFILV